MFVAEPTLEFNEPIAAGADLRIAMAVPVTLFVIALVPLRSGAAGATMGPIIVHVSSEGKPVPGATVQCDSVRRRTGPAGTASLVMPPGAHALVIRQLGFASETLQVVVRDGPTHVSVALKESVTELAEVVVAATRTQCRLADEPTRVEVTAQDDIEEQVAASPGNVAELLGEASGVRVQQISAGAGGASVRVRGLSGRYTKLLSDGLPLFGLSAESLGPLQISPVDLERVEVIKGAASALYGPTALGGVVNFISAGPSAPRQVLIDHTSRDGTNLTLWETRPLNEQWGVTLLASADRQSKQDVDGDGWADIPAHARIVARPRVFWNGPDGGSWFLTAGVTLEDRAGGTLPGGRVANGLPFRDAHDTRRADVGSVARIHVGSMVLSLRGSATDQSRSRMFGSTRERDRRQTQFGEVELLAPRRSQVWVGGASFERDAYRAQDVARMDFTYRTAGVFAQHLWSPRPWFGMSSSARADFHDVYGNFVSPRVSMLVKPSRSFNVRVAAGGGAFTPTPFTEETDAVGLARLRPIALEAERAWTASVDAVAMAGALEFDASLHRTRIERPVAVRAVAGAAGQLELINAAVPTRVSGIELFARRKRDPVTLTVTYALLGGSEFDAGATGRRDLALDPRQTAGVTVVWEEEDDTRIGLEAYYTGRGWLADDPYRTVSAPYVFIDGVISQRVGRTVLFVHGENLNNIRQTQFDPLLRPTPGIGGEWTTDVWAPLEGRVFNIGLKWRY